MTTDIYTKRPIVTDSEEHVLPSFLGGRLRVRGRLDITTNNRFGHGIEARLDEALRAVRVPLDARNSTGDPPRALESVRGADGRSYRVKAGGVMEARPEIIRRPLNSGEVRIEASVPNEHVVREMLRKHARRTGKDLEQLTSAWMATGVRKLSPPPMMTFQIPLWERDPYRATAKIACNLFAERDPHTFLQREFDAIRSFVLEGAEVDQPPVQACEVDVHAHRLGALDHVVTLDARREEVVGLVVYFGLLAFVVRLGHATVPSGLHRAYRVDQLGRSHRVDDARDLAIATPSFADAAGRTYEEFGSVVRKQLERLVPTLQSIQREIWMTRVIQSHAHLLPAAEPSEEQVRAFSEAVARDFAEQLAPQAERGSEWARSPSDRERQTPEQADDDDQ